MDKKKGLLLLLLCLFPSIVLADSSSDFPFSFALMMEAFVTIHMTVFVLLPISKMYGGNNSQALFKILFVGRILLLLYFDFYVTTAVALADFVAVFIGAFIIVPISAAITKPLRITKIEEPKIIEYHSKKRKPSEKLFVRCAYCGRLGYLDDGSCDGCGAAFTEKDVLKDWR